jgi:two-component system sensor histidine kinase DegS
MPRDSRRDLRAEFARVAEKARQSERTDIARELHDSVIQPLSALVTSLEAFELHPQPPGATEAYVAAWRELTDEAIIALRSALGGLRAHPHVELSLPDALYRYLVPQARAQGIRLTLESREWAADLPLDFTSNLYLLVREALTNVQKHARATEVTILLHADALNLSIIVADNGVGFYAGPHEDVVLTTNRSSGFGIVGMRERVAMLDGELTIVSAMGQGTRLEIRVPRPHVNGDEQGQQERDDVTLLEETHAGNQAATVEHIH